MIKIMDKRGFGGIIPVLIFAIIFGGLAFGFYP